MKKKKHSEQRRQAIYLDLDPNHRKLEVELMGRFLSSKEDKLKVDVGGEESEKVKEEVVAEEDPHLFTMNAENFLRSSVRR